MCIGGVGVEVDRSSIGCLRLCHLPGFLQGMAILDPHFGRVWHGVERLPIMPSGEFPFARLWGAFSTQDPPAGDTPRPVEPRDTVAPIATDTVEHRTDDFVGEKGARPAG